MLGGKTFTDRQRLSSVRVLIEGASENKHLFKMLCIHFSIDVKFEDPSLYPQVSRSFVSVPRFIVTRWLGGGPRCPAECQSVSADRHREKVSEVQRDIYLLLIAHTSIQT